MEPRAPSGAHAGLEALPPPLRGVLRAALASGSGEVRVETAELSGVIFVFGGAVAWVVAGRDGERLSDVLERREELPPAVLRECFATCRRTGENFAEALVGRGVVSREGMRAALLEHNARQLRELLRGAGEMRARFEANDRRYASELLYSPRELLAEMAGFGRAAAGGATERSGRGERATDFGETPSESDGNQDEEYRMADINESLEGMMQLDGAIAAAIVDWESGLTLGTAGGGASFDIELAASGNTQVVKSKVGVMKSLGIEGAIEDILITLEPQYHLIRPLTKNPSLFLYVALDKARGNLGLARHKLRAVEAGLAI